VSGFETLSDQWPKGHDQSFLFSDLAELDSVGPKGVLMRFAFFCLIVVAGALPSQLSAQDLWGLVQGTQFSVPVQAPVSKVFTPKGFDDNDTPQFVVEGEFENACYSLTGVFLAPMDRGRQRFTFFVQADRIEDSFCPEEKKKIEKVPYFEVVNLPKLKKGRYELWHTQMVDRPAAILEIEEAQNKDSRDNVVYALVDSAVVEKDAAAENSYSITLYGEFIDSCHEIDIENSMAQPAGDQVVVVLPKIKTLKRDECHPEKRRFSRTLPIKDTAKALKAGDRTLFHIRTMNGKSFNIVQTLTR
jgi:hypothetical protein